MRRTLGNDRELRQQPETQSILAASHEVRRECILALAWSSVSPDSSPTNPWSRTDLLAVVARKAAPLTIDDLEPLLVAAEAMSRGSVVPSRTMSALAAQFRHLYERSSQAERAELALLIERAAVQCHYGKDVARLRAIIARDEDTDPWEAIDARDDVGPRLRATLARTVRAPRVGRAID